MRKRLLVAVVAAVLLAVSSLLVAQSDPFLGTWKVNVAKSKYDPGPPPKSDTRVYEAWEKDGVKGTVTTVRPDGTTATTGFSAHYDGKDYPFMGSANADTISLKRVDVNTMETTLKKDGKVVLMNKTVISKDGKTRTVTRTGTTAQGQKVNDVTVLDKQ